MRTGLAGIALLALLACGATPQAPADVVDAYFAALGRDPMRSLPITTDAFHRAHGLSTVTTSQARDWRGGAQVAPVAQPDRVDRAQVAWLAIQNRADFARIASGITTTHLDVQEVGDLATVVVAIEPQRAAAFRQIFHLVREGPDAAWRIDGIEQSGVGPDSEMVAYVAHPTEAARRAIERRLRSPGPLGHRGSKQ